MTLPAPAIGTLLDQHSSRFSPIYQGFLSDHGPMAALALHGLGRSEREITTWYQRYCKRLVPFSDAPAEYREVLGTTRERLQEMGADALLAETLPGLISGWARSAYHPLIRLAYGYQFQIDGEIAAGLACLSCCGKDQRLEELAVSAAGRPADSKPEQAFAAAADSAPDLGSESRFDDRLEAVIENPAFARAAHRFPDALTAISRMALDVFDQTHDFFALHLVTGAHAYRVLYPFAGPQRDELFSLGILAGYAATGAPAFTSDRGSSDQLPSPTPAANLQSDDDHHIKLTWSAICQADHFADRAYARAAERYLNR